MSSIPTNSCPTPNKVEVRSLRFRYEGEYLFEDLSFTVREGEFVSLLGPSGCGKSTILNILAGILPADGGTILADGEDVRGINGKFAYMPQNDLLFPWKTILDNVSLYGKIHKTLWETKQKALELLPLFGLAGYENAYPAELSGGMRQRAAFLRTALCGSEILLLDEPFGALDVLSRSDMQDWLLGLRRSLKRTALLVTHDIDEAIYLSDRIYVLGGSPTGIVREFATEGVPHTREWLFGQTELRRALHNAIRSPEKR